MKIVDGHNLIGAAGEFGLALDQGDKEERLLRLLTLYRSRRRSREAMLVVFDGTFGRLASGPRRYSRVGIDVEWAIGETADEVIARRVRASRRPQEITVVTSDARVLADAASHGAAVLRTPEFLRAMRAAAGDAPGEEKPPAPGPDEVADWLERFEKGR